MNLELLEEFAENPELYKQTYLKEEKDDYCKNCDTYSIEPDNNGFYSCFRCGITKNLIINSEEEKLNHEDNEKDLSRTSKVSEVLPGASLRTFIEGNSKFAKVNNWNKMSYSERSYWLSYNYIKSKCDENNISKSVFDKACNYFKKIDSLKKDNGKKEIHRGNVREGIISACIYFALKSEGISRSPKEISKIMNINVSEVSRGCKIFLDLLGVEFDNNTENEEFVYRFCNHLGIEYKYAVSAEKIVKEIIRLKILTKNTPLSISSSVIYFLVCNTEELKENIDKKDISKCCGVSEITLIKLSSILSKFSKYLLKVGKVNQ